MAVLLPLSIREVSTLAAGAQRPVFEHLLHHYHYLSYRSPVGENLQYLILDQQERPLACVLFGPSLAVCRPG